MDVPHMSIFRAPGEKLLEQLPERMFAPLAAQNRSLYWKLFCKLYERRFGPHSPLPPANGYPRQEVTSEIEREMVDASFDTR